MSRCCWFFAVVAMMAAATMVVALLVAISAPVVLVAVEAYGAGVNVVTSGCGGIYGSGKWHQWVCCALLF